MNARDHISLHGLRLDCVVGVYPHERDRPQPLIVDVDLSLDTEEAGRNERLGATVNYAAVAAQLAFVLENGRFRLLETAAYALCRLLLAPPAPGERRAAIAEATLRLTKPGALGGRAVPALTVTRAQEWAVLAQEEKPFGTVDVICETRDVGIYRLNVAPGQGIPLHVHRRMREVEMVLGSGLLCQGRKVAPGTVFRWPHGAAHRYDNPTERVQTILCIDAPRFAPEDEIVVQGPPDEVAPERQGYP